MNTSNIIAIAMAGLMVAPTFAAENAPQTGDILQDINMFNPGDSDSAYKVKANDKFGTQWGVDVAYGYWGTSKALPGTNGKNNYALLHAQLNQRLIEDNANGGTWLRVELSGSWGLDRSTARTSEEEGTDFVSGYGTATDVHGDIWGPHNLYLPEVALMHYFAGKRACIIAGMVNLTNYFDAVGIANDSFASFSNTGFMNSTVLDMPDSNAGAILQVELNSRNYVMVGFSRETTVAGYDPFNAHGSNYMVVGEYGHVFGEGDAVLRINPFYRHVEEENGNGELRSRQNAGLAASIEYTPCDAITLFARAGFGAKQDLGPAADFSCGANVHLFPSREDDFFGIAYGVFKGNTADEKPVHNREQVLEVMYSFQVNDYVKIVPHYQYIHNPAYRADSRDASLLGVQAVLSF